MAEQSLSIDAVQVEKRREIFLEILARNGGNALAAAKAVGYPDTAALRIHRRKDPDFERKWDEAIAVSNDVLEASALDWALHGIDKPQYYQGNIVGVDKERNAGMLTTVLKARMPDKYSEKREITGTINHRVGVALIPMLSPSNEDWEKTALAHHEPVQTPVIDVTPTQVVDAKPDNGD